MASPKPRVEIPLSHSCWNGNIPTMRMRLLATLGFAIACFVGAVRAADTAAHAPTTEHIKAAIVKSLPLLTTAARGSMEKRERCFTCHNQGLPIMALATAQSRGFKIDTEELQKQLKPGQCLVSARGDLWRWDGFTASSDAPSQSAIRLAQRNRLTALQGETDAAREIRATYFADYSAAKEAAQKAREDLREAETQERGAEQALIGAQDQATRAARAAAERASQLASLESEIRRLTQSVEAAQESHQQAEAGLEELGDGMALNASVAEARSGTADARTKAGEARGALESLRREGEARARRLAAITDEQGRWNARKADASTPTS